ncbi:toll/interleukin-1 receptor domain-containing protein, partial [Vibrio parahaemolyticus]
VALEARDFDVLIDRRDLPALEDWKRELLGFIWQADTVVFITSRNSLTSKVCAWEVEQVSHLSKRLAPVVIEDIGGLEIPP